MKMRHAGTTAVLLCAIGAVSVRADDLPVVDLSRDLTRQIVIAASTSAI